MEKYKNQLKSHPVCDNYLLLEYVSVATLHCVKKHDSSLFSLPFLLLGRDQYKILGQPCRQGPEATTIYKNDMVS